MTGVELSGLRLWVSSLLHWPGQQLKGKLDAAEHRLEEIRESIQIDVERRARHFERVAAAWAVTGLLLAVAGMFFILGLWLGFAHIFGPVAASFLLAAIFVALASIPVLFLRKYRA